MNNNKKLHYAWVICGICMLMVFCNLGLCSNILAVYLPYIERMGISGSKGSGIVTVRCFASFLGTFFVSAYYRQFSLRRGIALATLLGGLGTMVMAFGGSRILMYYAGALIIGIAYAFGAMIPCSLLIGRWFNSGRGIALGLCSMGSGFATIVFAPVITAVVQAASLQAAFLLQAGFMTLCALLAWALIRSSPEECGRSPYGAPEETSVAADGAEPETFEIPKRIWIAMLFMMLLIGGAGQSASSHISVLTTTAGYTVAQSGMTATVYGASLIVGKIAFGRAADRLGALRSSVLFFAGCLAPLLMDGIHAAVPYVFAAVLGLGCPFFTVGTSLWAADLSANGDYEKTLRKYQIMYSAGGIVFSSLPGRIADITGEYMSSYLILLAMVLLSMVLLLRFYRLRRSCYGLSPLPAEK